MANPKLTAEQEEVLRAQNDACLRLPDDPEKRRALLLEYRKKEARQKDEIKAVKDEVGAGESLKRLTKTYGLKKQAINALNALAEMLPVERARALRQIIEYGKDFGWIIPDLFDQGAFGVGANDETGETAGFDNTSEGKRRGGSKAEPRQAPAAATAPAEREIEALPLDEARRLYEEALAKAPEKKGRGRKSNEDKQALENLAHAEKVLEAARAREGAEEKPAEPASNVVPIHEQMREASAAGDAHIKEQVAKSQAKASPDKPARGRKKAAATEEAPPPPADEAPTPPADDDEEDDTIPESAAPPNSGLTERPGNYQIS